MPDIMYERASSNPSSESLLDDKSDLFRQPATLHRWIPSWFTRARTKYDHEAITARRDHPRFWSFFGKLFLTSFAVWGILSFGLQSKQFYDANKPINCDCGSSIAEAKDMGCKYDSMAAAWLPDICRDDELTEEFNRQGPGPNGEWLYWSDPHAKHSLTLEDMALLADTGKPFFTTWDWHVAHCFGFFKKQIRGGFTKASLGTTDPYGHIVHCRE